MYSCAVKRRISVSGPVPTGVGELVKVDGILDLAPDMLGDDVDLGKGIDDAGVDVFHVEADGVIVDHRHVLDQVPDVADVERLVLLEHVVGELDVVRVEGFAVRPFDAFAERDGYALEVVAEGVAGGEPIVRLGVLKRVENEQRLEDEVLHRGQASRDAVGIVVLDPGGELDRQRRQNGLGMTGAGTVARARRPSGPGAFLRADIGFISQRFMPTRQGLRRRAAAPAGAGLDGNCPPWSERTQGRHPARRDDWKA